MTEIKTVEGVIEVQEDTNVDEEKKWCVYCHTNKTNGKKYFGITSKNPPSLRWENGYGYRRQTRFWNAIQKYGWDNFEHEIITNNLTLEEANSREVELISKFKSDQREFGYNIEPGGGASNGLSIETREKISKSHIGMHAGEKNYFYDIHMCGEENPFYGCKHSNESKKKMSESRKGFKNWQCKPVYSPEIDRIFWGAKAVENEFGVGRSRVTAQCRNKDPYGIGIIIDEQRIMTTWLYVYDQYQENETMIQGAITLGYITEEQVNEYLNSLKEKENDK